MKTRKLKADIFCLAMLLPAGCGEDASSSKKQAEADLSSLRDLPRGTRVPRVELRRKTRTRDQIALHMHGVAEALSGASLSQSEAKDWADAALLEGERDRYMGAPFSAHPNIHVSYIRHFDEFVVTDASVKRPGAQEMRAVAPNSPTDMGIGESAASTVAENFLAVLEQNGRIDAGPYAKGGTRVSRRTITDFDKGESRSVVADYTPYYYRTVNSVPLLNTLVAVTVSRDGTLKKVRIQEIESVKTNSIRTLISDEDAFALMATQAEASLPVGMTVNETVLDDRQVGYFLPAEKSFDMLTPVAKAKVVFKTPTHVGHDRFGRTLRKRRQCQA